MFTFTVKDINGKELTPESIVQLVDEDEVPFGDTSPVSLVFEDGSFTVRAFIREYACNILTDDYCQFVIVG
jgi:hypothetical protein